MPATAKTGAAIRNNRIHPPSVVTRRAAAELTGAVTRYRGVRHNKNNNDDDNNINNNNHAALAEVSSRVRCSSHDNEVFRQTRTRRTTTTLTIQSSRLWRDVSSRVRCTSCDNQLSTPTRTRRTATTSTATATWLWRNVFSRVRCIRVRLPGRYTNTDTPDTAHQLDAEAVPAEVAHTRTNTQPSCSGEGESDRVPNIFKEGMAGLRHRTS